MIVDKIDIVAKSKELKEYVSQFDTYSFITQICCILNTNLRTGDNNLNLESPVRQILYLLSLFINTPENKETKNFDLVSGKFGYIEKLLTEIEAWYRYDYISALSLEEFVDEETIKMLEVSRSTYIDYFVNAPLNYKEQEIEKIIDIFSRYDNYIYAQTGLYVNDYLIFFDLTEELDLNKYIEYQENIYNSKTLECYRQINTNPNYSEFHEHFFEIFDILEKATSNLRISKDKLVNESISKEKIDKILTYFSVKRGKGIDAEYLFYTQNCLLMDKPIIEFTDGTIIIPMQKQLIHAIYAHLFKICSSFDKSGKRILEKRDRRLEEKTENVFRAFLGENVKIYSNYYIGDNEKDLLILYRDTAFIVECKAYKCREPFMNIEKAFVRIKDDFKRNIQKGYDQAIEVQDLLQNEHQFCIRNKKGEIIERINSSKYRNIFPIIVTQDRLGQIQIDLGLLLDIHNNETYPWSVCLDDLEAALITLSRRESGYGDFITYLHNREKLHERVFCFDELELFALFLMHRDEFMNICNSGRYFLSNPKEDRFFDFLYNIGFGFENEKNIQRKRERALDMADEIKGKFAKAKFKRIPKCMKF